MNARHAAVFILILMISGPVTIAKGWERFVGPHDPLATPSDCGDFIALDKRPERVHLQGCVIDYSVYRVADDEHGTISRLVAELKGVNLPASGRYNPSAVVLLPDVSALRGELGSEFVAALDATGSDAGKVIYQQVVPMGDLYLTSSTGTASTRNLGPVIDHTTYDTYRIMLAGERGSSYHFDGILLMLLGVAITFFSLLGLKPTIVFAQNVLDETGNR